MSDRKLKIKKQGKIKREATSQSALVIYARVTRLATDHVDSAEMQNAASQVHSSGTLERMKKVLDVAKHERTSEHEVKQALRLSAKVISSTKVQNAQGSTCKDTKMQLQKGGHSTVTVHRRDGENILVRGWTEDILSAIEKAFNVKYYHQSWQYYIEFVFYGLRDNTVAAALSFEAVFNLCISLAAKRKNKDSYLLGLSSSINKMAQEECKKEEVQAVENEKLLLRKTIVKGLRSKRENQTEVEFENDQLLTQNKRRKLDEETPEEGWQTFTQLKEFRKMAERIASEYLKVVEPNQTCDRAAGRASIHDFLAYRSGNKDARISTSSDVDFKQHKSDVSF